MLECPDEQGGDQPTVATTREQVLGAAGSRYTYSANTLAYPLAIEAGAERIALVGMGCQASAPPVMQA
ncbi:MAG TPA: coenzyme F420 hydrogenase/dehydrogenase beta subunit N-terminal domain-containing protein, partial [Acidimicrobiales bacterium]|nr:coenzyme F420 hydrogenase/dehydrogenase beta subunit N-terminal domain-containing protein [Acidimicrobiales bacterium]